MIRSKLCFRKIFLVAVGKLEKDKIRGQKCRQAFRGATRMKIVAADMKRIRWILDTRRKRDNECICVHVGDAGGKN